MEFLDFLKFEDRFSEANSIKNLLKNNIQDGVPQFGSTLLPESGSRRSQDAPRRLRMLARHPQDAAQPPQKPDAPLKRPKDAPNRSQDGSKAWPRGILEAFGRVLALNSIREPPWSPPDLDSWCRQIFILEPSILHSIWHPSVFQK